MLKHSPNYIVVISVFLTSCFWKKDCITYNKEISPDFIERVLPYDKNDKVYYTNCLDTFEVIITDSLFTQILRKEGVNQDCKGAYSYFTINYFDFFALSELPGIDSLKISILSTKYEDCYLQFYFNGSKSADLDFRLYDYQDSVKIVGDGFFDSINIMNQRFKSVSISTSLQDTIYYTQNEGIVCLALNSKNQKFVLLKDDL